MIKLYTIILITIISCVSSRYTSEHVELYVSEENTFVEPTLITSGNASNFIPDLSPNGAYLLYTSDRAGNKDIWEKKISRGYSRKLTYHTADDLSPVMSPDGEYFAFVSRREDAAGNIHVMELNSFMSSSNEEADLSSFNLKDTEDTQPAWFPDSSKIVFTARQPLAEESNIVIGDVNTMEVKPLEGIYGSHPNPSPSGKHIAYSRRGNIYVYDLSTKKEIPVTINNYCQDGQPSFSPDGENIYFIRYLDDTNHDQKLNGDDRPSIWMTRFNSLASGKEVKPLEAIPLTSSKYSSYYPKPKPPFLYFTMQSQDSLDIYRLPLEGHLGTFPDKKPLLNPPSSMSDPFNISFLYNRNIQMLFKEGDTLNLKKVLIRYLFWLVQENRGPESHYIHNKIQSTFGNDIALEKISDLLLLKLKIQPMTYPDNKLEPIDSIRAELETAKKSIHSLTAAIPQNSPLRADADAIATIIKSRILGSDKYYFESLKLINETFKAIQPSKYIKAESQLLIADLISDVMDRDTAISKLIQVISDNSSDAAIAQKAAHKIVDVVSRYFKKQQVKLAQIRDKYSHLPWLSPIAHRRIVDIYRSEDKLDVAANELREMTSRYKENPQVMIDAATDMVKIAEASGTNKIERELDQMLETLKDQKDPKYASLSRDILIDFRLRKGETFIRRRQLDLAIEQFRSIINIVPDHINGHRGLIDINVQNGKIDSMLQKYEELSEKYPNSPNYRYLYIYVQTYLIDLEEYAGDKISLIDGLIEDLIEVKEKEGKAPRFHQTLGWLYFQRHIWAQKYRSEGGLWADLKRRGSIISEYFGFEEPNWLELSQDSYLTAQFLALPESIERADLAQNLAEAYFNLKNFKKSLIYYVRRFKLLDAYPIRSRSTEAIISHNAGKTALQLSEFEVAKSMFNRSLENWEALANDKEIARNLDYLGLSHLETGSFDAARKIFSRLSKLHERMGSKTNQAIALVNKAFALFHLKKYRDSLASYNQAHDIFSDPELKIALPESDGIEIGLAGGQASETKGFTRLTRLIQIETFRCHIYELLKDYKLALSAWENKARLQLEKKHEGEEEGRSDLYYSEELSVTYSNIGRLKNQINDIAGAANAYYTSYQWAKELREENNPSPSSLEWTNLANYARIKLQYFILTKGQEDSLKEFDTFLTGITQSLQSLTQPWTKDTSEALTRLIPINEQLHTFVSGNANFNSYENALKAAVDTTNAHKNITSNLLSFNFLSAPDDFRKKIPSQEQLKILHEQILKSKNKLWKYKLAKGMWSDVYHKLIDVQSHDQKSFPVQNSVDIKIFENLFDFHFSNNISESETEERFHQLSEFLAVRTYFLSHLMNPNNTEFIWQVLETYDLDSVKDALQPDEAMITVYQDSLKSYHIFYLTKSGLTYKKSNTLDAKIVTTELSNSTKLRHIYLPFTSSLSLSFIADIRSNTYSQSILTSPGELVYAVENRIPESISVTDLGGKLSDYSNLSHPLEYHSLDNDTDQINSFTNILHCSFPLKFDKDNPSLSRITKGEKADLGDFILSTFNREELDRLHTLVFSATAPLTSTGMDNATDIDLGSLIRLHISSLSRGISTTILSKALIPNGHEKWLHAYEAVAGRSLASFANSIDAFMMGYAGLSQDVLSEELEDLLETSIDDESYREALFYTKLANQFEDVPDIFVDLRNQSIDDGLIKNAYLYQKKRMSLYEQKDTFEYGEELKLAAQLAIHNKVKDYENTDTFLKEALNIFTKEEEFQEAGNVARLLAINYERQKNYDKALEQFKQARIYFLKDEDQEQASKILLDIGNQHSLHYNDYALALKNYELAYDEFKNAGNEDALQSISIDKANALIVIGQVAEAIKILKDILSNIDLPDDETISTWVRTAQILTNAYFRSGQIYSANEMNLKVMEQLDELPEGKKKVLFMLDASNVQALILAKTGEFKKAYKILQDGIKIAQQNDLQGKVSERLNNLGYIYREHGKYRKSVEVMERALEIDRQLESERAIAFDLRNLGLGVALLGDLGQAKEYLERSLELSLKLNLNYNATYCYFGLGDIALKTKKYSEAISRFEKARNIATEGFLSEFQWRSLAAMALALEENGDLDKAIAAYQKAINSIEKQKPGQKTEISKTGLQSDIGVSEVYSRYASLLAKRNESIKSWTISEKSRSRNLIDTMSGQNLVFADEEENKYFLEERTLRNKLELSTRSLSKLEVGTEHHSQLKKNVEKTQIQYVNLIETVKKSYPRLLSLIQPEEPSIERFQKMLHPGTAVVEYMITRDQLLIWVIKPDSFKSFHVKISANVLVKKLKELQNLLKNYSTTEFVSRELSDLLIEPIHNEIADVTKLGIIPHSYLNHLSFALLQFDSKLLIERFPIFYLESALFAKNSKQAKEPFAKSSRIIAIGHPDVEGDPIPFSFKEMNSIKRYFKNTKILNGKDATIESLINLSDQAQVLHIATHGEFHEINPIQSSLILAKGKTLSGVLNVGEIIRHQIKAPLVTMSACESGLNTASTGHEVLSLNRALFFNGSQNIISSLWRINDVTSAIVMKRFYRYLSQGLSLDEALRKSQLLVRQYFHHPSYWSAFRLLGMP